MNREILFKGWCPRNEKWIEGDVIIKGSGALIRRRSDAMCFEVDPSTVCQYTGLTDRNGVKIWEGDIVKWFDDFPMKTMYAQIVYVDGAFVREYEGKTGTARLFINARSAKKCKVCGNIFDNPELLEGGKGE